MLTCDQFIAAMHDAGWRDTCDAQHEGARLLWRQVCPRATPPEVKGSAGDVQARPPAYMLAKLAMVMPLFQEARDALTALTEQQRVRHGIRKDLADRMDVAGTYSLDDWLAFHAKPPEDRAPAEGET